MELIGWLRQITDVVLRQDLDVRHVDDSLRLVRKQILRISETWPRPPEFSAAFTKVLAIL